MEAVQKPQSARDLRQAALDNFFSYVKASICCSMTLAKPVDISSHTQYILIHQRLILPVFTFEQHGTAFEGF